MINLRGSYDFCVDVLTVDSKLSCHIELITNSMFLIYDSLIYWVYWLR